MAVVINEFEVVPEPQKNDNQTAKKSDGKGGPEQPPTDYEINQMMQRRIERMERVSAH
jgi:hypothetical protein